MRISAGPRLNNERLVATDGPAKRDRNEEEMAIKPPFTDLDVATADSGFYEGNSVPVALLSKGIMVALVLWAMIWPGSASDTLGAVNTRVLELFNSFYIVAVGAFVFFLLLLAIIPQTGRRVLGRPGEAPEFSTFSWFAMMFGAGLGVGLMVFATAEPLGLWGSNPEIIAGNVQPNTADAIGPAYRFDFLHYGFQAWGIYVVTGLALAYYAFTRGMPLTIRTALTPLFGPLMNGFLGHVVDVLGMVATILGVSVTVGFGVAQFIDGVYAITGMEWMMNLSGDVPTPSTVGLIAGLVVIMGMSILSAVSGVGRGIKYLSNLNLVLSCLLLLTFVVFGSFMFALTTLGTGLVEYLTHFIEISFGAYGPQSAAEFSAALPAEAAPHAEALMAGATDAWGSYDGFVSGLEGDAAALPPEVLQAAYAAGEPGRQFGWQAGWTTFYWAWWIAFSPFVGLFLARISKGRTVREFVVGCVIAPSLVCFLWMTILGGTAIDLELSGVAEGSIIGASNTAKLFVTLSHMIDGTFLSLVTVMCVVLVMTFLVTSADSGILVINTIMSGGDQEAGIRHRIIWGLILTAVIGVLIIAAGEENPLNALQNAMIIGALPFAMIMVLMCIALLKALIRDGMRDRYTATEPAAGG